VCCTAVYFTNALADPVDTVTGIVIYPPLASEFVLPNTKICGKKMQKAFAKAPVGKHNKAATVIAYYRAKLPPSMRYSHSVVQGTSQDTFMSTDGSSEVTVTGTPQSDEVYAISFGRFTPPLSPKEGAAYGSGKLACG
jgi:hypothetical protein